MIVVVDSNVWISALEFGGTPDLVVVRALTQDQIAISAFIRDEVVSVLVEKFGRDARAMRALMDELLVDALWGEITHSVRGVCRDPKDDAILETALKVSADLIVAGDKDLLSLNQFRNTRIVSPAAYLRLGAP